MKPKRYSPIMPGQVFNRWTVIGFFGLKRKQDKIFKCKCSCGTVRDVLGFALNDGGSMSCGCLRKENARRGCFKHGGRAFRAYSSWDGMNQRCSNKNASGYKDYGGRGVTVCERWRKFENFLADMGERPSGTSIDRINNNGNYEPGNCKWSTRKEQQNNMRSNLKNRVAVLA